VYKGARRAHFWPTKALFYWEFFHQGERVGSGRVLRQMVPALLLVVPATAALWGGVEFVQAAEECKAKPGSTAPPGSGWYYRINRVDHRHCWFLGTKNTNAHLEGHRQFAADSTGGARQEHQAGAEPQIVPSQIETTDEVPPAVSAPVPQAPAPTLDAAAKYLVPRSVPTVTFRALSPDGRTPFEPKNNASRAPEQPPARVGNPSPTPVALAEAVATCLLFVGGILFVTLLARRRSQWPAILRESDSPIAASLGVPVVKAPPTASKLPDAPPMTADEFSQSLRELRRNLRQAEVSIQRRFQRAPFEPLT
jgi:hypothetical protein